MILWRFGPKRLSPSFGRMAGDVWRENAQEKNPQTLRPYPKSHIRQGRGSKRRCVKRSSPPAHRGARVIGTDAAYLPGIAKLRRKARAGSEDNPNVNAHQSSPLMGKSTIETIHEVRLKQFCARLTEGLSRPVNPQELKTSRWRRHAPAALFLFRPADDAQRVPRSPYCRGAGSNLEIFSKAMASNLAA